MKSFSLFCFFWGGGHIQFLDPQFSHFEPSLPVINDRSLMLEEAAGGVRGRSLCFRGDGKFSLPLH